MNTDDLFMGPAAEARPTRDESVPPHAIGEHGECASWCRACSANVRRGLNPDGTPRDESVPPPGITLNPCIWHGKPVVQIVRDDAIGDVGGHVICDGDLVAPDEVPESLRALWARYDAEHGYAPPAVDVDALRGLADDLEGYAHATTPMPK